MNNKHRLTLNILLTSFRKLPPSVLFISLAVHGLLCPHDKTYIIHLHLEARRLQFNEGRIQILIKFLTYRKKSTRKSEREKIEIKLLVAAVCGSFRVSPGR